MTFSLFSCFKLVCRIRRYKQLCHFSTDCNFSLGMESREIPVDMITASSQWDINHVPQLARLNNQPRNGAIGAWVPKKESK